MGWGEKKLEELAAGVAAEGERTRLELADAFAQSVRGLRIDGALVRPVRANAIAYNVGGRLVGWSIRGLGAAQVILHDGLTAGGDVVAVIGLTTDGMTQTQWFGPGGISFVDGLFAEVAGSVLGAVYIGAVD